MKLKRIDAEQDPGYPSFRAHRINRRGMLKYIFGGIGAMLIGGCKKKEPPSIMGETVDPRPPAQPPVSKGTPKAPESPPQPDGEMPMPEPPGKMSAPAAPPKLPDPSPKDLPLATPVEEGGDIVIAEPPKPSLGRLKMPSAPPPKIGGDIKVPAPVQPPPPEEHPKLMGFIQKVKPPSDISKASQ